METITSSEDLKEKIQALERRQHQLTKELDNEFHDTYEHLRPANLIKSTVHNFSRSDMKKDIVKAATILAIGYIAKRIVMRASRNPLRILLGNFAEVVVASYIAKHPDQMKRLANSALRLIMKLRPKKQPKLLIAAV